MLARAFLIGFVLVLCGCEPHVAGNETGGTMEWFGTNQDAVFSAAQKHCDKYGKSAHIKSIEERAGGSVVFDCVGQ